MSDKSFVTIISRICVSCGNVYHDNEEGLAIHKTLKPCFEAQTVVGFGICDDCLEKTKKENGLWVFSTEEIDDRIELKEAVCFKEEALREMIPDLPETPKQCIQFDNELLQKLLTAIGKGQEASEPATA